MKKTGIALGMVMVLNGCVTSTSSVSFVRPDPVIQSNFNLVDIRPAQEKTTQTIETGATAIRLFGDDSVHPSIPVLLKAAIANQSIPNLQGQTVTLKSVRVMIESPHSTAGEYNPERHAARQEAAMQQAATVGYAGAAAGALMYDVMERIFEKANENTIFTVKVFIEGDVGNETFSEYAFSTYDTGNGEAQLKEAITEAIDRTTNTINRLANK